MSYSFAVVSLLAGNQGISRQTPGHVYLAASKASEQHWTFCNAGLQGLDQLHLASRSQGYASTE